MSSLTPHVDTNRFARVLGKKNYELTNHLGNVLVTVTDQKIAVEDGSTGTVAYWNPKVVSYSDYMPFGSQMVGRKGNTSEARFGFNGQEKDDEVYGTGNSMTAEFWQYDARLGRRWNVDPVVKEYESPYATFGNNPIWFVDPSGADTSFANPEAKKIFDETLADIDGEISDLKSEIEEMGEEAKEKEWSDKKLARKTRSQRQRLAELNNVRQKFTDVIESDIVFTYSTKTTDINEHIFNNSLYQSSGTVGRIIPGEDRTSTTLIVIRPDHEFVKAYFVHETTHGSQVHKSLLGFEGAGYDYMDEYEAYTMQDIYNRNSVSSIIHEANLERMKFEENIQNVEILDLRKYIEDTYADKVKHKVWKQVSAN